MTKSKKRKPESDEDEFEEEIDEPLISSAVVGEVSLTLQNPCRIKEVSESFTKLLKNSNIKKYLRGYEIKKVVYANLNYTG